jgi:hypothetical protein
MAECDGWEASRQEREGGQERDSRRSDQSRRQEELGEARQVLEQQVA